MAHWNKTQNDTLMLDNARSLTPSYLTYTLAIFILTLLITRISSSRKTRPTITNQDGARTVAEVPYWLPLLGHLPNMAFDADGFIKGLRKQYDKGIFALNFGGGKHNIIYSPGLATALLNQKSANADSHDMALGIMRKVFGFPGTELEKYNASLPDMLACYKHLLGEPSLSELVDKTARTIKANVVTLVSFSESLVDETLWERSSGVSLATNQQGEQVVEASMLPLIRDFCAHTANPSLMGSNFLTNYPEFFEDIWTLDRAFLMMASGLPRWVPIPSVTSAHIARRRILERLCTFHRAMEKESKGEDPGPEWRDLDDVGALVKARMHVYHKHGYSIQARAAIEHSLMWAANANSNALVFWMLNRIYADQELLRKLREEISPYVRVVQPKQEFKIPEQPRFDDFDMEGLGNKCPLLKSCYIESLRLDTASWSLKVVESDFVLKSREKDAPSWLLKKGEYVHAAHDLHSTNPAHFDDPMVWKADRHIKTEKGEGPTADMGSIRPYGGGASMCKGRSFAFKEVMAFAAGILVLWDMEPAGGGEWKIPKHKKATGVYTTSDNVRVWVKQRDLSKPS